MFENRGDLHKSRDVIRSWTIKLKIIKMALLPKLTSELSVMPIRISMAFLEMAEMENPIQNSCGIARDLKESNYLEREYQILTMRPPGTVNYLEKRRTKF